jgi:hypothetical protein
MSLRRDKLPTRISLAHIGQVALVVALLLSLLTSGLSLSLAEEPNRDFAAGRWQLETLKLKDGKEFRGLSQDEGQQQFDFAEIFQPAGKPMYAVVRGINREQVASLKRLTTGEHKKLAERFRQFRNRAVIEAGRMEQVALRTEKRHGATYRIYKGDWFELLSTTDDEASRKCVVRIEQIFRAYRLLLPPNVEGGHKLQVQLFGSLTEYRTRLRDIGLSINHPACYSPREHLILAGSELTAFEERLAQTRAENDALRKNYTRLDGEFAKELNRLSRELKEGGFSPDEIASEMRLRRSGWKTEMEGTLSKISEVDRRNAARFRDVTEQMFARLNHEAFHAYLDLFVYPHDEHHVPRWLNEGLAQVFENAQLEGDSLRIDAPDRERLRALQGDSDWLPLAKLLTSGDQAFLSNDYAAGHGGASVRRTYLYSWALAHYLAFHEDQLAGPALDEYVAPQIAPSDPIARFESLVGMPLSQFEQRFRQTMLGLKP